MKKLTETQREHVLTAIGMRINYIETGNTLLSAADAAAYHASAKPVPEPNFNYLARINVLTDDQKKVILELKKAANIFSSYPVK